MEYRTLEKDPLRYKSGVIYELHVRAFHDHSGDGTGDFRGLTAKLDWSEPARRPHQELLDWHRQLIALRRTEPAVTDGRLAGVVTRHHEQERWLVVERGPISVAAFAPRLIHCKITGLPTTPESPTRC